MAIKREETRTLRPKGESRSPSQIWGDEIKYQATRIQEAGRAICDLARRRSPAWTPEQVKDLVEALEEETQKIRDAYATPAEVQAFQFSEGSQSA